MTINLLDEVKRIVGVGDAKIFPYVLVASEWYLNKPGLNGAASLDALVEGVVGVKPVVAARVNATGQVAARVVGVNCGRRHPAPRSEVECHAGFPSAPCLRGLDVFLRDKEHILGQAQGFTRRRHDLHDADGADVALGVLVEGRLLEALGREQQRVEAVLRAIFLEQRQGVMEALRIRGRAREGWLIRQGWLLGVVLLAGSVIVLI